MSTAWFERGDGARFEVPLGSEAYANLVAQGAIRIAGPDAPSTTTTEGDEGAAPTKAELLERAAELGLNVPQRATNAVIAAAIADEERLRAESSSTTTTEGDEGAES